MSQLPFILNMPTGDQVRDALAKASRIMEVAAQIQHGHLDRAISMTSESGPVGLGFLDLTLELFTRRRFVQPVRGAFQVRWVMAPTGVTIHVGGETASGSSECHRLELSTTLKAADVRPGIVGFTELLTDRPVAVTSPRGKTTFRQATFGIRLRVVEVARPIGSVPMRNGGVFVPLAA